MVVLPTEHALLMIVSAKPFQIFYIKLQEGFAFFSPHLDQILSVCHLHLAELLQGVTGWEHKVQEVAFMSN